MLGTRRPVIVRGGTEEYELLTHEAVLHGTKKAPCLAGWYAKSLHQQGPSAIITQDLQQAWLFRRDGAAMAYRAMTCKASPGADVPQRVWQEEATTKDAP